MAEGSRRQSCWRPHRSRARDPQVSLRHLGCPYVWEARTADMKETQTTGVPVVQTESLTDRKLGALATKAGHSQPGWKSLPLGAKAFRIAHIAWGAVAMGALGYIWACAIVRRRDRYLWAAIAFLLVQGVALVVGGGNCPFGPFQRRLGDPVPMFELVLPPRAAKAAIPVLLVVTIAGMVAVVTRTARVTRVVGS